VNEIVMKFVGQLFKFLKVCSQVGPRGLYYKTYYDSNIRIFAVS
jgi:hypothetical protein